MKHDTLPAPTFVHFLGITFIMYCLYDTLALYTPLIHSSLREISLFHWSVWIYEADKESKKRHLPSWHDHELVLMRNGVRHETSPATYSFEAGPSSN